MYSHDDYNLDRLSREAAEKYETPGKPSWEPLRRLLDKELPLKKDNRRRGLILFFIIAVLLAGGSIGGYLYLRGPQEPGTATAYEKTETAPGNYRGSAASPGEVTTLHEKPGKQHIAPAIVPPHSHQTITRNEMQPLPAAPEAGTRLLHQPLKPAGDARQISRNKADIARLGHQGIDRPGRPADKTAAKHRNIIPENPSRYAPPAGTEPAVDNNNAANKETGSDQAIPATDTGALGGIPAAQPQPKSPPTGKQDADSTGKRTDKNQRRIKNRGFSVALTGGADFSTVKFTYGDKTGYTAGITGAWHFNSRWSLHTGALYTQKNYKLKGSDYNPPEHYWTQYVDLQSVEGYCRMWELPLQARFGFPSRSSRQFFLSAGLSSYFMRKESYNYYYKLNNSGYERPWTNKTHLNHWFSILDLSAGVEKKLNKRFSIEAEPYARIPLSGVGFGSIRLSSLGLNVSLRYRQPARR